MSLSGTLALMPILPVQAALTWNILPELITRLQNLLANLYMYVCECRRSPLALNFPVLFPSPTQLHAGQVCNIQ